MEMLFYIASPYSPTGNCVQFWAIDGHGYTSDLDKAWKVSRDQAEDIIRMKRGDRAYPVEQLDAIAFRHVDVQLLRDVEVVNG